jgi:hypothetical protein
MVPPKSSSSYEMLMNHHRVDSGEQLSAVEQVMASSQARPLVANSSSDYHQLGAFRESAEASP